MSRAQELISLLGLQRHPEGGWYRELFRSTARVVPADGRGDRAALTVIYFLLQRGEFSAWHVVASDECWQYCEGSPLELLTFDPRTEGSQRTELGPVDNRRLSFSVVPAAVWQAARSLGDFTLVQCTVGPGFDFHDFRLLRDVPDEGAGGRLPREWDRYL